MKYVVYTQTGVSNFTTNVLTTSSGEVRPFSANTFPRDKCVWDKNTSGIIYCAIPKAGLVGSSLDNWYLGYLNTSDNIYKIDIETDTATLLSVPNENTDISSLAIAEDNSFVYYINRTDNSLWTLPLIKAD